MGFSPIADIQALWQNCLVRWIASLCAAMITLTGAPALAVSPWIVFFETNSTRLTPQTVAILDNVAVSFRAAGIKGFQLFAHTDRVGTSLSNHRLAQRRAQAVRAALADRGIPENVIEINSRGEEGPLVETKDGVAERQNRRVEIVITCIVRPAAGFEYMQCPR